MLEPLNAAVEVFTSIADATPTQININPKNAGCLGFRRFDASSARS